MSYTDYYLKAANEAAYAAAADGVGDTVAVDVIGEIDGVEGWHVNIRAKGALPGALAALAIEAPAHPERVWYGA